MDNLRLSLNNSRTRLVLASMVLSTFADRDVLALVYVTANRSIESETRSVVSAELTGLADEYERRGPDRADQAIERRLPTAAERDALYLLTDRFGNAKLAGNLKQWPERISRLAAVGSSWSCVAPMTTSLRADLGRLDPPARRRAPAGWARCCRAATVRPGSVAFRGAWRWAIALALSLLTGWLFTRLVFFAPVRHLPALPKTSCRAICPGACRYAERGMSSIRWPAP